MIDGVNRQGATVKVFEGLTGPLLSSEKHFFRQFNAEYRVCSSPILTGTGNEKWDNAKELRTEIQTGTGTTVTIREWSQPSLVWGSDEGQSSNDYLMTHGQDQAPNDPRVLHEDTILEDGKMKRVEYEYDQFSKRHARQRARLRHRWRSRPGASPDHSRLRNQTVNYNYDGAGRRGDKEPQNLAFKGNLGDGISRTYSRGLTYNAVGNLTQEQFGTDTAIYITGVLMGVPLRVPSMKGRGYNAIGGPDGQFYQEMLGQPINEEPIDNNTVPEVFHDSKALYYSVIFDFNLLQLAKAEG